MGLDIDIYTRDGCNLVSLEDHPMFLALLSLEDAPQVYPDYDDLLLTEEPVACALLSVEADLEAAGAALVPIQPLPEARAHEVTDGISDEFFFFEPGDRIETLLHYRVILTRLLAILEEQDLVICCSA